MQIAVHTDIHVSRYMYIQTGSDTDICIGTYRFIHIGTYTVIHIDTDTDIQLSV
ncbi:hypothetical protein HMPREF0765_0731 [Sphingobacterium spiritivorum ATCC 33300]|uniref:Uncharacterized protein n=1 Tax=Sphingobacterium spiritivorum ATCC 33300 TaxID=525372 RepID=C2FTU9_SPHSI|nr:hypothetical protein HMPREF0765_0731 [Sphingobacterium spiritivorum ATCC 33300]